MRIPESLTALAEYGIIEEVLRPLMSGKEAQIFSVRSGGEYRVAKVYKEAQQRSFKHRSEYTEGRKVRNTRDQRAMSSGSRHGRAQVESAWRTTEVDMIYRMRAAGVRVPEPYHFVDGVLVMEMITDEHGEPAPRLGEVSLDPDAAQAVFDRLLSEVVRMLAAGVVHGDLSDFNVLMGRDGPVIIDFPQAVDASSNHSARKLLLRDVANLHRYMERFVPEWKSLPYAQEMWALYERGELVPDTRLSGRYLPAEKKVSTDAVLDLIGDATRDERRRREQLGLSMRGTAEVSVTPARPPSRYAQKREAQVAARLLEAQRTPPPAQRTPPAAAQRTPHPAQRTPSTAQHNAPRTAQHSAPRTAQRTPSTAQHNAHRAAQRTPSPAQHDAHRAAQRTPSPAQHDAHRTAQRTPSPAQHNAPRPPAVSAEPSPKRRRRRPRRKPNKAP